VGLDRAIARLTNTDAPGEVKTQNDESGSDLDAKQIYAKATEWVAGLLLHELASPIGLLAYEAFREVPRYAESRMKLHIDKLQTVFCAIEQLKKASATPKPEEFDLAALIDEIVTAEFADAAETIGKHGPRPLLLISDRALLNFAICNGLRNAVEAVRLNGERSSAQVVVTWGETDVDYWVSIIDNGPGLTVPPESVFEIGKTTKAGHSGFGLAIAVSAIQAVGGAVTLEPATGGGAKYELRWE
jgi:signal transduction histidine kinase